MPNLRRALLTVAACVIVPLALAYPASADTQIGTVGSGAGQYEFPRNVAVDTSTGHVYIADNGNHRVDVFDSGGSFITAFGWGVSDGSAELQTCVATCLPGLTGGGAGEFANGRASGFEGIAVDNNPASPSQHDIYTFEGARVQKFTPDGQFLLAWGGGVVKGGTPVNEIQKLVLKSQQPNAEFGFRYIYAGAQTQTAYIPFTASASTVQNALTGLSNIGAGNVAVTGPDGGPFTITFQGDLADTDVAQLTTFGDPGTSVTTVQNGHNSAAICTAANAQNCRTGVTGTGQGQFAAESTQLGVGPGGTIYVLDSSQIGVNQSEGFVNRVQVFDSSGAFIKELGPLSPTGAGNGRANKLTIDSSGSFYASGGSFVSKFSPSGTLLNTIEVPNNRSLAVDSADNLFASSSSASIREYDAAGTQHKVFYSLKGGVLGLAVYPTGNGDVFAVEEGGQVVQLSFPQPGPLLPPGRIKASGIGNARATLEAEVNPEGKATTFHFEYVDQSHFETGGFANPATKSTAESPLAGADFGQYPASFNTTGLSPETKYHFRLVASNEDGTVSGEEAIFETLPPLQIGGLWASDVDTDSARLHLEVNSLGVPSGGYFQYIDDAGYQSGGFADATDVPDVNAGATPIDFGSAETPKSFSVALQGLVPGTVYHYRILAQSSIAAGPVTVEHTFTTYPPPAGGGEECPNQAFRLGASAALPECRAYEMVSPLDKGNGDVLALPNIVGFSTALDLSASSGERFTFTSYRAFAGAQAGPWAIQYLASRGAGGWSTEALSPATPGPSLLQGEVTENADFKAFSADLSEAWLRYYSDPPLDSLAPAGFPDLYRRDLSGGYEALNPAAPPKLEPKEFTPELQGTSDDGAKAIFAINEKLTTDATSGGNYQLYESSAGKLRLVSILPSGKANPGDASAGTKNNFNPDVTTSLDGAISADGSRVFWTAAPTKGSDLRNQGTIYLRENADQPQSKLAGGVCTEAAKACTVRVSEAVSPEPAQFQLASADGDRALFTVRESAQGDQGLYEFIAATGSAQLIAHKAVENVLGASEDASRVYFVSREVLTGANAQGEVPTANAPNLYFHDANQSGASAYRFIGRLGDAETSFQSSNLPSPVSTYPVLRTARATPDGEQLVFTSAAPLTGYDNTDLASGKADTEVYRYDAGAEGGAGELRCLSCNPSGARPAGREVRAPANGGYLATAAIVPPYYNQLSQPRYLTEDGTRVFFNAYDSLTLADTNGKEDVYEWRAPGSGGCEPGAAGFSAANGGCLSLISSGQSPSDSELLDAGADGTDVFFSTAAGLVPQDYGLIDVYDARVRGGYPAPAGLPAACEGEACQGPLVPPNDPTPASATFRGAGNVSQSARPPCAKGKARRKGRCRAKKKPKQASKQHKRTSHDRRAGR